LQKENRLFTITKLQYDAVIFDLDGVVTKTAKLHAATWKRVFDDFLKKRAKNKKFKPFDISNDYLKYIDGKPRYEGIKSFLASRGIELPEGQPDDLEHTCTVCALGNKKNRYFLELLQKGVETYKNAIDLILKLNDFGFSTAIVSSSKNCASVLESANIAALFDTKVDGVDLQNLELPGKPEPDIFLEAAKRLGIKPYRAIVIEDSIAGVKAAKKGGFGKVIAIDRADHAKELKAAGADIVVKELFELEIETKTSKLPSALKSFKTIEKLFKDKEVVLFLDFDGTLTPIVAYPKDAYLQEKMKNTLIKLSNQCTIAILSGRGLSDIKSRVGINGVYYSGSHGFEIEGPGIKMEYEPALEFIELFDKLEYELKKELESINGALVERKKFSIALHYRNVSNDQKALVEKAADETIKKYPKIRKTFGKEVYELLPNLNWNKGAALEWLVDALQIDKKGSKIFYIGDDITDEDAFCAIKTYGIGILVSSELRKTGAQYKLEDTDETLRFLEILSASIENGNIWSLFYDSYRPKEEKLREALCALGNGYFVTRAAVTGSKSDNSHYPGTYMAGCYNRLKTKIADKEIKNEDLVNLPDWLMLKFRIEGDKWFLIDEANILSFRQELDMEEGLLHKLIHFSDAKGRETRVIERRFVHMANKHIASLELSIMPINYSGKIEIESGINGDIKNEGVKRYRGLSNQHLKFSESKEFDNDTIFLKMQTVQSDRTVAQAVKTKIFLDNEPLFLKTKLIKNEGYIAKRYIVDDVKAKKQLTVEKTLSLYTSKDKAISNCSLEAKLALEDTGRFESLLIAHKTAWKHLWKYFDIDLKLTDLQKDYFVKRVLHLYAFHLLQTASIHSIDMDVGIPARGWHGEAYRGHIFWDEVIIFPFFNYRIPQITRSLILYRYRRLQEARRAAREFGYKGAMYPWQSGSNGKEETQKIHLNPRSKRWIADNTHLQHHINSAIVYNIWQYYQVSEDFDFLYFYGTEMILEIARFWASIATYNKEEDRFEILGVMGPDEYHDSYPDSKEIGLKNNAYTNIMAVFTLNKALQLQKLLPKICFKELCEKLQIEKTEIKRWKEISTKIKIPFHNDGIISQFEGYEKLKEFDWDRYRKKYKNIQRLDRILEAEGDCVNRYKVSKQADVLMLFYLFSKEELKELFSQLGYAFKQDTIKKNVEYYLKRTSSGSSLSQVVHAWVSTKINREKSWEFFNETLMIDIKDLQGGTTPEGIHIGAMAGSIDIVQRCYTGLEAREDVLRLDPSLPTQLQEIKLHLYYRRQWLDLKIYPNKLIVEALSLCAKPINMEVKGKTFTLSGGEKKEILYEG